MWPGDVQQYIHCYGPLVAAWPPRLSRNGRFQKAHTDLLFALQSKETK